MKKLFTILLAIFAVSTAFAQAEKSIIIDQNTFRPVQKDALTGVNIDPIELDSSKRPCARLKVKINRMTREEINAIEVKIITNNQLTKNKTAEYDNGLILELTAKPQTRFYFHHDEFGDSNEVCLNLEADKEYYLEAYLNQQYSIVVMSNIADAEVYIDDVLQGRTDANNQCSIKDVLPGKHNLRIQSGAVMQQSAIEVHSGKIFFKLNLPTGTDTVKYKVGDYYNDGIKEGVVFEVTPDGKHGKIVSMKQSVEIQWASDKVEQKRLIGTSSENEGMYNMHIVKSISDWQTKYPAFAYCASLGEDWYLPAIEELKRFTLDKATQDAVNKTLVMKGGTRLYNPGEKFVRHWSSTEHRKTMAWCVTMTGGYALAPMKYEEDYVRAVAAF